MSDLIQLGMSSDSSELVDSVSDVRGELKETQSAFQKFADSVSSAMSAAGDASVAVLREMGSALHTVTHSALESFGEVMGMAAGKVLLYRSAVASATTSLGSFWDQLRVGISVASYFAPWLAVVSLGLSAATAATIAYRHANDELVATLLKSVTPVDLTRKGLKDIDTAGGMLSSTLKNVVQDFADTSVSMIAVAAHTSGIVDKIRTADTVVGTALETLSGNMAVLAIRTQVTADMFMDMAAAGGATSAQLREMAAATANVIAKQEAQAPLFGQLRAMQDAAAAAGVQAAELQRIASFQSVAAVEAEIRALQEKANAAILAGQATEQSLKQSAALFAALENQKNTIANTDKAAALQAELAATEAINRAKEHQRDLENTAADQVARLTDQIDLLSGAATKADIAMREAMRAGLGAEKANEIAGLTAELEKLQAEANAPKAKAEEAAKVAKADRTTLKAAFQGSQEAASIFTRGIGGVDKDGNVIAKQQLTVQQQTLVAIKTIKMPQLQPLSLGTA